MERGAGRVCVGKPRGAAASAAGAVPRRTLRARPPSPHDTMCGTMDVPPVGAVSARPQRAVARGPGDEQLSSSGPAARRADGVRVSRSFQVFGGHSAAAASSVLTTAGANPSTPRNWRLERTADRGSMAQLGGRRPAPKGWRIASIETWAPVPGPSDRRASVQRSCGTAVLPVITARREGRRRGAWPSN